jgi:hypothetical protein
VKIRLAILVVVLLAAYVPPAFASAVSVNGTGVAFLHAKAGTLTTSLRVSAPGVVKLVALDTATFKPVCLVVLRRPCVRWNAKTQSWIVLRAVKFIYAGGAGPYALRVQSRGAFQLGVNGVGTLVLTGNGLYTLAGRQKAYQGVIRVRLR